MFLYFFFRGLITSNMADLHKTLSHMLDLFTGEAHGAAPIQSQSVESTGTEAA